MGRTADRTLKLDRPVRGRSGRTNLDVTSKVDCVQFTRGMLGIDLWPAQEAVMRAVYGLPITDSEQVDFWAEATREVYGEPVRYEPGRELQELDVIFGRRSGKSRAISSPILVYESLRDWSSYLGKAHEYVYCVFMAESIKQARDVLGTDIIGSILSIPHLAREVVYHDQKARKGGVEAVETTSKDQLVLSNRSIIKALPPDKSSVRGRPIPCLACDEIAWWPKEGEFADKAILQALKPSRVQFKDRWKILKLSSPADKQGVLYDEFSRAVTTKHIRTVLKAPTWACNPTIAQDYYDREKEDDPVGYAMEYGAEFADSIDALIPRELLMACVGAYSLLPRDRKQAYLTAIDPAGSATNTGDPISMAVGYFDQADRKVRFTRTANWQKTSADHLPGVIEDMVGICETYGTRSVYQDQYAAEWVALALVAAGLSPVRQDWTRKLRVACGEKLRGLVDQQRLEIPNDPVLIDDILSLQRVILDTGVLTIKKSRRSNRHGDLADCVMILCKVLDQGSGDLLGSPESRKKRNAFAAKMAGQSTSGAIQNGKYFGGKLTTGTGAAIKASRYYGGQIVKEPWKN